jgi:hypothetical protein
VHHRYTASVSSCLHASLLHSCCALVCRLSDSAVCCLMISWRRAVSWTVLSGFVDGVREAGHLKGCCRCTFVQIGEDTRNEIQAIMESLGRLWGLGVHVSCLSMIMLVCTCMQQGPTCTAKLLSRFHSSRPHSFSVTSSFYSPSARLAPAQHGCACAKLMS